MQQLALGRLGIEEMIFVPYSHHSCICGSVSNLLVLFCVRVYFAFCTASGGARECLPVCIWHGAISVSGLSLEGMPSPKHLRHPKCSAHRMEVSVCKCVCYAGLAACHLSPRALAAPEKMPSQNRWQPLPGHLFLALSKQTNGD